MWNESRELNSNQISKAEANKSGFPVTQVINFNDHLACQSSCFEFGNI